MFGFHSSKLLKIFILFAIFSIFILQVKKKYIPLRHQTLGALAHLARAFDWQSRGDQFESGMLHKYFSRRYSNICGCFFKP